jgi:hypothetical protein
MRHVLSGHVQGTVPGLRVSGGGFVGHVQGTVPGLRVSGGGFVGHVQGTVPGLRVSGGGSVGHVQGTVPRHGGRPRPFEAALLGAWPKAAAVLAVARLFAIATGLRDANPGGAPGGRVYDDAPAAFAVNCTTKLLPSVDAALGIAPAVEFVRPSKRSGPGK